MTHQADPMRLLKLSAAGFIVAEITGDRPCRTTMHRWAKHGLKGVKLKTAYAGGSRRTSEKWIKEFFEAVTQAAEQMSEVSNV